jgi:hypothetical protein
VRVAIPASNSTSSPSRSPAGWLSSSSIIQRR